ncbi:hypothetical protein [Micromonospora sp. NPDC006431]|uniref:hypothetical protein n=1 Tax=Micromonospora sp. NPDC006431 TaxID=3364235 RepID=UPI0036C3AC7C
MTGGPTFIGVGPVRVRVDITSAVTRVMAVADPSTRLSQNLNGSQAPLRLGGQ